MNNDFLKLMLVTHREQTPLNEYLDFIKQCIQSGVTCIQLREKNSEAEFKLEFAKRLKQLLTPFNIPLIINDDLHLALAVDADGVHLGQSDGSPMQARELLGNHKILGLSIESESELQQANLLPVNYVAASAVFPSIHKHNVKTIWGIEGLIKICKSSNHPVIAIGGINQDNLNEVIRAGAKGAAVIGALHQANNPAAMALHLHHMIANRMVDYDS